MYICIFEDDFFKKLMPLVHFRPVYDLKCGITSLKEKIIQHYPKAELILHVRNYLAAVVKEKQAITSVNEIPDGAKEILMINGRLLLSAKEKEVIGDKYPGTDIVYLKDKVVVAAWLSKENLGRIRVLLKDRVPGPGFFESIDGKELPDAQLVTYPWELVLKNGAQLVSDFKIITNGRSQILGQIFEGAHLINPSQIHIEEGAKVKPGVVLDAEELAHLHFPKCANYGERSDRGAGFYR